MEIMCMVKMRQKLWHIQTSATSNHQCISICITRTKDLKYNILIAVMYADNYRKNPILDSAKIVFYKILLLTVQK